MNKQELNIWGRSFKLDVVFDCYGDEEVLPSQTEALNSFLANLDIVENCKKDVIDYCLKNDSDSLDEDKITNIFKYVMPQSIYISRTKDNSHLIGIMCAYKFDMEHGIAIIFKNEKLQKISIQDELL